MPTKIPVSKHDSFVFSPKIGVTGSRNFLALRWYALEFDRRERVESDNVTEQLGVKSYKLFEAHGQAPLEEVKRRNPHAMKLHISTAGNLAVVSSQIGYDTTRAVEVPTPIHRGDGDHNVQAFDMTDYAKGTSERDVLLGHVRRLTSQGGDPAAELDQEVADDIFHMMWSGLEERR